MNWTTEPPLDETPSDFPRSLVDAMRRVVDASRDRTLTEMRDAVETEAGHLDVARSARETALRERAEAEITGVGTWERAEIERMRAEAVRKVQARGRQLDEELAALAASTNAEHAALAARADAFEHEMADFIEGLDGIDDPAAFAAAARRMPTPWSVSNAQPPALAVPEPPMPEPVRPEAEPTPLEAEPLRPEAEPVRPEAEPTPLEAEPLRPEAEPVRPEAELAPPEAELAPPLAVRGLPVREPALPTAVPAPAVAVPTGSATSADRNGDTAAEDGSAEEATSIQVRGLSSFGAITSFKQALERVDGIHSVTLGLGPGGEFVYTATHAPTIDLNAAILGIEVGAEIARDGEMLRVKVGRKAG